MLYNSQIYYFKDTPDYTGEFLLRYRDGLTRALERFEIRNISLASYIGKMLKYYRLNFYKDVSNKEMQRTKVQNYYTERFIEELNFQNDHAHASGEYIESYLGEDFLQKYPKKFFTEDLIERVRYDIAHGKRKGRKSSIDESKILLMLLILSEEELSHEKQQPIFRSIGISQQQYDAIIKNRDDILQNLSDKKYEQERLLERCFFHYKEAEQEEIEPEKLEQGQTDREKLLQTVKTEKRQQRLERLQNQYLQMKTVLSRKQVAELAGIPYKDISKYYNYLRKFLSEPK